MPDTCFGHQPLKFLFFCQKNRDKQKKSKTFFLKNLRQFSQKLPPSGQKIEKNKIIFSSKFANFLGFENMYITLTTVPCGLF